jgi:hypothetical protein
VLWPLVNEAAFMIVQNNLILWMTLCYQLLLSSLAMVIINTVLEHILKAFLLLQELTVAVNVTIAES